MTKNILDENNWLELLELKVDNLIHQINHYLVVSMVCFVSTYPLDSATSGEYG